MAAGLDPGTFDAISETAAERALLGCLLIDADAFRQAMPRLTTSDFHLPEAQLIFAALQEIHENGVDPDPIILASRLRAAGNLDHVGGEDALDLLVAEIPSLDNWREYEKLVLDASLLRGLEVLGAEAQRVARQGDGSAGERLEAISTRLSGLSRRSQPTSAKSFMDLGKEYAEALDAAMEDPSTLKGVPTGFYDLDSLTGGLFAGDLIILAARPAMGKTAFAVEVAYNMCCASKMTKGALIYSLEMSGLQLFKRLVSSVSMIPLQAQRRGINAEMWRDLSNSIDSIYSMPIWIDDKSVVTVEDIKRGIEARRREFDVPVVIVDYLQLLKGRRAERRDLEVAENAKALKAMAKDMGITVIALAQVSRGVEARENKRPMLADLRESGSIEAEADLVLFLYRDAYYKTKDVDGQKDENPHRIEEVEVILAKHRNGPTGTVTLGFNPNVTKFRNLKL